MKGSKSWGLIIQLQFSFVLLSNAMHLRDWTPLFRNSDHFHSGQSFKTDRRYQDGWVTQHKSDAIRDERWVKYAKTNWNPDHPIVSILPPHIIIHPAVTQTHQLLCFSLLDSCTPENMLPLNGLSWRRAFVVYGSPAEKTPTLLFFFFAKNKMRPFTPKYFAWFRGPQILSCPLLWISFLNCKAIVQRSCICYHFKGK